MTSLEDFRDRLTGDQSTLLTAIWDYCCANDRWMPRRILHQRFKELRKQGVRASLDPLGGSLVFEARDQGEEVYQLTLVGALLTHRGRELEDHLARLLEHFRDQFDADPEIRQLSGEDVQSALDLSAEQALALFQAVWISNLFSGGSKGRDLQAWRVGLPYEIEDIPAEARPYLQTRVLKDFDPAVPFTAGERETYLMNRSGNYWPLIETASDGALESVEGAVASASERGETARSSGDRVRRLRAHRRSLLALEKHLRELASEGTSVVPVGQFRLLATQAEEVEHEFPRLHSCPN